MLQFEPIWFIVLLANFLFLLFALNIILFKPMIKIFKERENTVNGSLQAAKDMAGKRDSALDEMKKGLSEAAVKARAAFEELRNEGLAKQKDSVSAASAEAMKLTEGARQALRQEADKARHALKSDVEKFSEEIVKKLVKV